MTFRLAALWLVASAALFAQSQGRPELVITSSDPVSIASEVALGGGGRWIASVDAPTRTLSVGLTRVVDTTTGRTLHTVPGVTVFAAHPVEDMLVVVEGGLVRAVNPLSGVELWRYRPTNLWTTLQFTGDGAQLFGGWVTPRRKLFVERLLSRDGSRSGQLRERTAGWFLSPAGPKLLPAVSSDGRWVHALSGPGSSDGACRGRLCWRTQLRDIDSDRPVGRRIDGAAVASHRGAMRAVVAWADGPDASYSASWVGSTLMRNVPKLTLVDVSNGLTLGAWPGLSAAFSADGSRLLIDHFLGGATIVDARTGATLLVTPPAAPSARWALSPDTNRIIGVAAPETLLTALVRLPFEPQAVGSSDAVLLTQDELERFLKGRPSTGTPEEARFASWMLSGRAPDAPAAALTADGRWLVARGGDGQIDLWDAATGAHLPFRLPSPTQRAGPLYARSSQLALMQGAGTAGPLIDRFVRTVTNRRGVPVGVDGIMPGMRLETVDLRDSACALATGGYEVTPEVTDGRISFSANDLTAAGFDAASGCQFSPDGQHLLGMATASLQSQPLPDLVRTGEQRVQAALLDLATRATIVLRRGQTSAAATFASRGISFHWTLDGRFIVGMESPGEARQRLRVWSATDGAEVDVPEGLQTQAVVGLVLASPVVATSQAYVVPLGRTTVEFWDVDRMERRLELPDVQVDQQAPGGPFRLFTGARVAWNGTVTLTPDADGALRIRAATGLTLGHLRTTGAGDWLVTTPTGFFDGSPGAWRQIGWRPADGARTSPGELYFNEYFRPGLLGHLLAGESPRPGRSIEERDRRQPSMTLMTLAEGPRSARVRLDVREAPPSGLQQGGSGVRDVRLFRNGALIRAWRGDLSLNEGGISLEAVVTTSAGVNRFAAYAFNRDNVRSQEVSATVVRPDASARPPTTYILAIGVNEYANATLNLRYAVPDARAFGTVLGTRLRALEPGSVVQVVELADREATRTNILLALALLGGTHAGPMPPRVPAELARLAEAQPEDRVFVYFAGHGVAAGDRFHLIPTDAPLGGLSVRDDLVQILLRSISDLDLERALEPIGASQVALVIDACQSGQALGAEDERRGPMNSRGLAQLAYEKGMTILAASQAHQAALESAQLGHGFLTFALVEEGLASDVADRTPVDGVVTVEEWFDYAVNRVPQLQAEALTRAELEGRSLRFDLGLGSSGSSRLQTPRVFTRRDTISGAHVVLKTRSN